MEAKPPAYIWMICFLSALCLKGIFGQHSDGREIQLRFIDSATGYAVRPQSVLIHESVTNRIIDSINPARFAGNGSVSRFFPLGMYRIIVQAEGYAASGADIHARPTAPGTIKFFLDPVQPPPEFEPETISPLLRTDATFISGFVVDDLRGQPLENVFITSEGKATGTFTDRRGYFRVYLPNDDETGTLRFEKDGYVSQKRIHIELWPGGDWQYRIRLRRGDGEEIIDEQKSKWAHDPIQKSDSSKGDCEECAMQEPKSAESGKSGDPARLIPALLPATIRVGRNCPGPTSCSSVEVYSLRTYCKFVLPAEWFSCWGSLSNGMNSLQAGAVAIRSFAVWHVFHPLTSGYDICDNTFCQYLGNAQTSNGNTAVETTARYVLTNSANEATRSEYSAENNNKGCGDCYSGTAVSWPCISDPVCCGQTSNGHGRGMCQWGSARWATATVISTSAPCSPGAPHAYGVKSWPEILDHYYPDYFVTLGAAASIVEAEVMPGTVSPGQTFSIEYTIDAAPAMSIMLGASVAPASGGPWIDDPANDLKVNINEGVCTVSRLFDLPGNAAYGPYNLLVALWYDVDNNNQINSGDFVFHIRQFNNAFTVGPTAITAAGDGRHPAYYSLAQNYPNPFNPLTSIEFSLPQASTVSLKIYNALGEEIVVLVQDRLSAGRYLSEWDAGGLPSGIYFYRLSATAADGRTGHFSETRKLILSK